MIAGLLFGIGRAQALERWFLPGASGSGTSIGTPARFDADAFKQVLESNPSETSFVFSLLPSESDYAVEKAIELPARAGLGQLQVTIRGLGNRSEEVRLINTAPLTSNGGYPHLDPILKLDLEQGGASVPETAAQIIVEKLLLDGNWGWKMAGIGHPSRGQGYKNAPLKLKARTGRVREVIVRNFGAIGYVPWSHFGGAAGVETFPFVVSGYDVGQTPPMGWRRPWEVVNCEIHGFNGVYGGYTTELLASPIIGNYTPAWATNDPGRRFTLVHNVQFRSESDGAGIIAMGNASEPNGLGESGRTTFSDNIVLNASLGYNADTGRIRNVDIRESLGLNVWWWMNANFQPNYLTHNGVFYPFWGTGYNVVQNSVRFGARTRYGSYRQFCWDASASPYTDVSLVLGRAETNHLFTLAQLTSMGSIRVEDNWYTTLPIDRMDDSGVGGADVRYRVIYKTPSRSGSSCDAYAVSYSPGTNFFIGGNTVSLAAFDFWPDYTDAKVTYPTFDSTTAPSVQMESPGIAWVQGSFPFPYGRTARVLPQISPVSRTYSWRIDGVSDPTSASFPDDQLTGAWEVVLGDPLIGTSSVTVRSRMALQETPKATWAGFQTGVGKRVWLKHDGLASGLQSTTLSSDGEATFTVTVPANGHGELNVTAFYDTAFPGPSPAATFSQYSSAYATATIPLGTVVRLSCPTNVAADRREVGVQRARFRLTRSGSTAAALPVAIGFSGLAPAATYGTDFTIQPLGDAGWAPASGGLPHRCTIPVNQSSADFEVVPVFDELLEREVVWLTVLPGAEYAPSVSAGTGSIFIYDGPEWSLIEITHATDPFSGVASAVGVSNDATAPGGNADPAVAANMLVRRSTPMPPYGYIQTYTDFVGASWSNLFAAPSFVFDPSSAPPYAVVVSGISDAVGGFREYSGYQKQLNGAFKPVRAWIGGWTYLTTSASGWLTEHSKALGISPNAQYTVGYATRTQVSPPMNEQQPAFWRTNALIKLFPGSDLNASRSGEAVAVNDDGEIVGHRVMLNVLGTQFIPRAFRSRAGGKEVLDSDLLIPPSQTGYQEANVPSAAKFITSRGTSVSGLAGGWATKAPGSLAARVLPVVWWRRADSSAEVFGAWLLTGRDEGVALASSNGLELFGKVSDAGGVNSQAWMWPNGWTPGSGFADKFRVYGFSGSWQLQEIVDATPKRVLLGNGIKNGSARGFLLIPLKTP